MNQVLPKGTRLAVGQCPKCHVIIAVINEDGPWPLAECQICDWKGGLGGEMLVEMIFRVGE